MFFSMILAALQVVGVIVKARAGGVLATSGDFNDIPWVGFVVPNTLHIIK